MLWNLNSPIHFGDFSWCLTHLSFCELVIPCRPSPCTRFSLARTTTAAPLPCRIFRSCGHSHKWRSGLGNLRLDSWKQRDMMSEWVFVLFPLTAAGYHGYLANRVYMSPFAMTYGEFSYPTPPAQVCRLGLPLKQFSFAPHSYRFILPFSSGMIAFQLTTLPACCIPIRFPLRISWLMIGDYFTCLSGLPYPTAVQ